MGNARTYVMHAMHATHLWCAEINLVPHHININLRVVWTRHKQMLILISCVCDEVEETLVCKSYQLGVKRATTNCIIHSWGKTRRIMRASCYDAERLKRPLLIGEVVLRSHLSVAASLLQWHFSHASRPLKHFQWIHDEINSVLA